MVIISRLLKIYAAENDIDDEELKQDKPFKNKPDIIVPDVDGYYLVKFLEQEFGKKDLGNIFKRRNGKPYNGGYIKSIRDGKKGVTEEFLLAVQDFYPNITQDLQGFMQQVVGPGKFTDNELGEQKERESREQANEKYNELKSSSLQPETMFANFLVAITGMNVAQIQDILAVDPNSSMVGLDGKKTIPKALVEKAKEEFDFTNEDFKNYKADPNSVAGFRNSKVDLLKRKYLMASRVSKLKKFAI